MSGKPKQGIDYAGWSVTMFDGDRKIDKLLDAQGWKGFGVYFFLCQLAYKMNGYFLEWCYDDCASTARKMGGYMGADTVEATVKLCLQVGLFDQKLFDGQGVLTSKDIQRRFWSAAAGRRAVPLNKAIWLLPPEEAEGLDKHARFVDSSPTNGDSSPTNDDSSPTNAYKVKESKVKQSKGGGADFSPSLQAAFDDWISYKEEKRQPYTSRGIDRLKKQISSYVEKYGTDAVIDIINVSMAANYAEIVLDRLDRGTRGQKVRTDADYEGGMYSNGNAG